MWGIVVAAWGPAFLQAAPCPIPPTPHFAPPPWAWPSSPVGLNGPPLAGNHGFAVHPVAGPHDTVVHPVAGHHASCVHPIAGHWARPDWARPAWARPSSPVGLNSPPLAGTHDLIVTKIQEDEFDLTGITYDYSKFRREGKGGYVATLEQLNEHTILITDTAREFTREEFGSITRMEGLYYRIFYDESPPTIYNARCNDLEAMLDIDGAYSVTPGTHAGKFGSWVHVINNGELAEPCFADYYEALQSGLLIMRGGATSSAMAPQMATRPLAMEHAPQAGLQSIAFTVSLDLDAAFT